MRLTRSVCVILLITAAACSTSLTAPPSGLPVALTSVETPGAQLPPIISAGDSVVAVVIPKGGWSCGSGPTAVAGLRGEDLVVTVTRHPADCRPGVLVAYQPPLKLVVHHVPSGTVSAKVVLRLVSGNDATYTVLASGAISID